MARSSKVKRGRTTGFDSFLRAVTRRWVARRRSLSRCEWSAVSRQRRSPARFFMEDVLGNRCRDIAQTVGFEFETTVCLA